MDYWEEYWGTEWSGQAAVDETGNSDQTFGPDDTNWLPGQIDNGDGSWTDVASGEVYDDFGNYLGQHSDLFPDAAQPATDDSFIYDPGSGLYYDTLTGLYLDEQGNVISPDVALFADPNSGLTPRDGDPYQGEILPPTNVDTGRGFLAAIGDFFGNLLGGSNNANPNTGGNTGGNFGGGSSNQQQAQQRQQQAAQNLANATANPNTTAAQLAALQQQYLLASRAAAAAGGTNWGTIAAVAGAGAVVAYFIARKKSS